MHVFWGKKKFVQLLLLNKVKARWSENRAAQGFHFINSFISNFFGPNSKTCTCKVRAARGRVSRGLTVHRNYFNGMSAFLFSNWNELILWTLSSTLSSVRAAQKRKTTLKGCVTLSNIPTKSYDATDILILFGAKPFMVDFSPNFAEIWNLPIRFWCRWNRC